MRRIVEAILHGMIEAAREMLKGKHFCPLEANDPLGQVTFSVGIATTIADPKQALLEADQALYETKNSGRHRTIQHQSLAAA